MHLKLLFAFLSMLFFSDNGGGGSGGDGDGEGEGGDGGGTQDDKGEDVSGLKSALAAERSKANTAERELKAAQSKIAEFENKDRSEGERATSERDAAVKRADEAETRLRDATSKSAVLEAATKARALSANAIYALIRSELEFDDDGEPTTVDALIASAKADEPELFREADGSADGGARDGDGGRDVQPGQDRLRYAYETESKTAKKR